MLRQRRPSHNRQSRAQRDAGADALAGRSTTGRAATLNSPVAWSRRRFATTARPRTPRVALDNLQLGDRSITAGQTVIVIINWSAPGLMTARSIGEPPRRWLDSDGSREPRALLGWRS